MKIMENFELKDFISESLKQIIIGVQAAQVFAEKNNALINPSIFSIKDLKRKKFDDVPLTQPIEFDVAVTIGKNNKKEGGIGIIPIAASLGLSGKLNFENISQNVSRIKFQIPVRLPSQTVSDFIGSEYKS
jgi:hypothetical protein